MIGAVAAALALAASGVVAGPAPITREVLLMGTRVTMTTWDADRARGLARLEGLLESLESTDARLSTWKPDSEVSRLNASSSRVSLSPVLCETLTAIDRWVRETGGAFDPAIGSLTTAWRIHDDGHIPSATDLRRARGASGWRRVAFDAGACTAGVAPGVSIDVGGFGKGAALDAVRMAVHGTEPWIIDMGGQIGVSGLPPGEDAWIVPIADPRRRDRPAVRVRLTSGSLSTSGRSERDVHAGGRRIGHILDPRTGQPAPFTGSVTVWHDSALAADALSTALFVMGPERGLSWADARGIAACYLEPGGRVRPSRAFRPLLGGRGRPRPARVPTSLP